MPRATAEQLDEVQATISKVLAGQEYVIDNIRSRPSSSTVNDRRAVFLKCVGPSFVSA
jgi:hypothetical protein